MIEYVPCSESEIPAGVRFDTPRRNGGQIVTESYGTFDRSEADWGDEYMRITDASDQTVRHFRRSDVHPAACRPAVDPFAGPFYIAPMG